MSGKSGTDARFPSEVRQNVVNGECLIADYGSEGWGFEFLRARDIHCKRLKALTLFGALFRVVRSKLNF
jgi:hypothetical protein